MNPPHIITLNCPVCGHSHASPLVATYDVSGSEADFCPKFEGDNPLPAMLHVCPLCGYSGFAPDFGPMAEGAMLESLRGAVRSLDWTPGQVLTGTERYRRAALFAVWLGKRNAEIAELWLQTTWCARLEGCGGGQERRARQKAIKYFEIALAEGEFSPEDTAAVHYLLGELNRRAGRSDHAVEEFRQVTPETGADGELLLLRDRQLDEVLRTDEAVAGDCAEDAAGPEGSGPGGIPPLDFSEFGGVDPSKRHRRLDGGGQPPTAA